MKSFESILTSVINNNRHLYWMSIIISSRWHHVFIKKKIIQWQLNVKLLISLKELHSKEETGVWKKGCQSALWWWLTLCSCVYNYRYYIVTVVSLLELVLFSLDPTNYFDTILYLKIYRSQWLYDITKICLKIVLLFWVDFKHVFKKIYIYAYHLILKSKLKGNNSINYQYVLICKVTKISLTA